MSLGGGWAWERQQENSSFANFGRVLACAVCKCAVLCVGIFLLCLYAAKISLSFCHCLFFGLLVTIVLHHSCYFLFSKIINFSLNIETLDGFLLNILIPIAVVR